MEVLLDWRLDELSEQQMQMVLTALAAMGMLYTFLGYRLFKVVLWLTGFLVAGSVAATFVGWLSEGRMGAMCIGFLVGGFCGAMALFFLYRTGVAFLGFAGGLVIGANFLLGQDATWAPWAILGIGLISAGVALLMERPVMTLATAAIGSWLVIYATAFMILGNGLESQLQRGEIAVPLLNTPLTTQQFGWLLCALWAALTLLGVGTQLFAQHRRPNRPHKDKRDTE